jgi:phage shock protein C
MNERLYRTVEDRMLFGVLGGLSLRVGVDPSIARVIYAILTVITGIFPLVIAYVIMAIVIPESPAGYEAARRARVGVSPGGPAAGGPSGWPAAAPSEAGPSGWPAAAATAAATPPSEPGPAWGAAWPDSGRTASTADGGRRRDDARAGAIVGGLVLVGLGGLFLLVQLAPQIDWAIAGPAALVALGVILILGSIRRA